jgi:hypothetical protein
MQAKLEDIKTVSLPGLKHTWKLKAATDVVSCEGDEYVRVAPANTSLMAIVLENNSAAPDGHNTWRSISRSVGLSNLTKLRCQAVAEMATDTSSSQGSQQCSLFSDEVAAAPKPSKKQKLGRKSLEGQERSSLEVSIMVGGESHSLKLLKPTRASDCIFALYEPSSMGLLVHYLREQGFSEEVKPKADRDPTLPKGIRARRNSNGNKFIVVYDKDDGTKGYRQCGDIESAFSFQANPAADQEGTCPPEEDAPEDAEEDGTRPEQEDRMPEDEPGVNGTEPEQENRDLSEQATGLPAE